MMGELKREGKILNIVFHNLKKTVCLTIMPMLLKLAVFVAFTKLFYAVFPEFFSSELTVYADNSADSYSNDRNYNNYYNYYNENLSFDSNGNLIMTTHDKKATTSVTYRTIGFVIKRYNMPAYADYQQYAIISIGNNVEYINDDSDASFVYCRYTVDESVIAAAIGAVSREWFHNLYSYGDYVYIDEIMTVSSDGVAAGGLSDDLKPYGEVYYDYKGISSAREWASKESLRTHFDKQVYFMPHEESKNFQYASSATSHTYSNRINNRLSILGGTRYRTDYNVADAIPTGARLSIYGSADTIKYNIVINRINMDFYIPIKLIIRYNLEWTDYNGRKVTEQKDVSKWYYVKKSASYYTIGNTDIRYLSAVTVSNYAFENHHISAAISGCKPVIEKKIYGEYYHHIEFPQYDDVYYIDGGTIKETKKTGVKPSIPDEDFQKTADTKIKDIKVKNDSLKINKKVVLDDTLYTDNASVPAISAEENLSSKKNIYFSGYIIPGSKANSKDNQSSGYYIYTDNNTGVQTSEDIARMQSVTIHTPVYIGGGIIENIVDNREEIGNLEENNVDKVWIGYEFRLKTDSYGEHIEARGYGLRDYSEMISAKKVKFACAVMVDGIFVEKDTWIDFDDNTIFKMPDETQAGQYEMTIRVYADNYVSLADSIDNHIQDTANLDINNYAAQSTEVITAENRVTKPSGRVVGTH